MSGKKMTVEQKRIADVHRYALQFRRPDAEVQNLYDGFVKLLGLGAKVSTIRTLVRAELIKMEAISPAPKTEKKKKMRVQRLRNHVFHAQWTARFCDVEISVLDNELSDFWIVGGHVMNVKDTFTHHCMPRGFQGYELVTLKNRKFWTLHREALRYLGSIVYAVDIEAEQKKMPFRDLVSEQPEEDDEDGYEDSGACDDAPDDDVYDVNADVNDVDDSTTY